MHPAAQQPPLLSVTVLNYNYGRFLPKCLDSILGQQFSDFELILINDSSTDHSLEVIEPYLADPRVRLIDHERNQGFVASLIEGCELSRGRYITVISADDWIIDPSAFDKQIAVLEQDPEVAFVFTSFGVYEHEQRCAGTICPWASSGTRPGLAVLPELLLGRALHHSGTIIRKTAYQAVGGYDRGLRYAVDLHMWLSLCHIGSAACINEVLYAYRQHGGNMTRDSTAARHMIGEVLMLIERCFGMLTSAARQELGWAYRPARRKALLEWALMHTFEKNDRRQGWHYFLAAAQLHPLETVFQKQALLLALRMMLGRRGFRAMEQLKAVFDGKTRARLEAEVGYIRQDS